MNESPWVCGGKPQMRGHRMGTWQRDRDEDLALFHDMRARERTKFLYPSNDDIETSLSTKFGGLSGHQVTATVLARKGSGDLLVSDPEKNDYDWLLTPPGTPLFPSLDQDGPIVNLSQRGALTRSASASKTSRLSYPQEPSSKVLRGNPSPRRPSTPSSTSSTTSTNRGRPSSPSITSSSPTLRPSPTSFRPTTPTRRASSTGSRTTSRSSTPTLQRMNTSPVIRSSSASKIGSTNGNGNGNKRGKSLSPNLRPWDPSMPGFSSEPPPNLRTSLSDRSIQRGRSPGPRNGGTSGTRNLYVEPSENNGSLQHTTSTDVSRSWSLSNSQDRDSSQMSKGSVISSFDDDIEIAESVESGSTKTSSDSMSKPVKIASRPENAPIGRSILPAKRQTRSTALSGDTASLLNLTTKRSYARQMDQHQSSQTMFRPLLSSVPVSSFYTTRSAAGLHSTSSVPGSSVTVSGNGSAEHSAKFVLESNSKCGDDEEKKSTGKGVQDVENSGDLVEEALETVANYTDSTVSRGHFSDLGMQETEYNDVEKDRSTGKLPKVQALDGTLSVEAKGRIKAWNGNQVSMDVLKEHNHAVHDTRCLTSYRQNIDGGYCSEENPDGSFLHVGSSMMSHVDKVQGLQVEIDARYTSPSQNPARHVQEKQLTCPMELGGVHVEGRLEQGSRIHFLSERHEPIGFKDGKCDMDVDLKSFNNQGQGQGFHGEQHAQEHCKHIPQTRNVNCSMQQFKGHGYHLEENKMFDLKNNSNVGCFELPFENALMEDEKSSSIASSASSVVPQHAGQWPITDMGSFGGQNSMRNPNVRFENGMVNTERVGNCDVPASHIYVSGENLAAKTGDNESDLSRVPPPDCSVDVAESLSHSESGTLEKCGVDCLSKRVPCEEEPAVDIGKEMSMEIKECLQDDSSKKQKPGVPFLKRNVTLEEATDTILFCNSIVHEIVYKAAEIAIQKEDLTAARKSRPKREIFFGVSEAERRNTEALRAGNRKEQPASTVIQRTFRYAQKQRMVHQRTPAVTLQQSPMDRTENAIIGNQEEELTPVSKLNRKKTKQAKKVKSRCRCRIM